MRLWPTHFPRTPPKSRHAATSSPAAAPGSRSNGTAGAAAAGGVPLVAHDGVAELAESMFDQLRPYVDQADDVGMPICFAGHSLGTHSTIWHAEELQCDWPGSAVYLARMPALDVLCFSVVAAGGGAAGAAVAVLFMFCVF